MGNKQRFFSFFQNGPVFSISFFLFWPQRRPTYEPTRAPEESWSPAPRSGLVFDDRAPFDGGQSCSFLLTSLKSIGMPSNFWLWTSDRKLKPDKCAHGPGLQLSFNISGPTRTCSRSKPRDEKKKRSALKKSHHSDINMHKYFVSCSVSATEPSSNQHE